MFCWNRFIYHPLWHPFPLSHLHWKTSLQKIIFSLCLPFSADSGVFRPLRVISTNFGLERPKSTPNNQITPNAQNRFFFVVKSENDPKTGFFGPKPCFFFPQDRVFGPKPVFWSQAVFLLAPKRDLDLRDSAHAREFGPHVRELGPTCGNFGPTCGNLSTAWGNLARNPKKMPPWPFRPFWT